MKGIVFVELIDMVDEHFGEEVTERIIEACDLESGGAYTSVGTYDHNELIALVSRLSQETEVPVPALLRSYGKHLFGRFHGLYPEFFTEISDVFNFISKIEDYIHVEVRKLYPDAELPAFGCVSLGPNQLELTYQSCRPFADFCGGLLEGCIEHFEEEVSIERESVSGGDGCHERFLLTRAAA